MIRLLTSHEEKLMTRPLYERVFDHDGKGFVDYYYEDRCRDNRILVDVETDVRGAEQVVSMIHLNPYTLYVNGEELPALYVFAVATDDKFRHQGRMARLLEEVDQICAREDIPFLFLIPVDTAIYTPFGYQVLCELQRDKSVPYEEIRKNYDVYCVRDADYLRRMEKEAALAAMGEVQELPEHSVIMVKTSLDLTGRKPYFMEEV